MPGEDTKSFWEMSLNFRRVSTLLLMAVTTVLILYSTTRFHAHKPWKRKELNTSKVPEGIKNLTIVSQNIWLLTIPFFDTSHAVKERLDTFADAVASCDLVLIQEIFVFKMGPFEKRGNYLLLERLMLERGFAYQASSEQTIPKYLGQNSGLVIYSKYPIVRSKSYFYKDRSLHEKINNKGYIIAELANNGHPIYVATTHLDAADRKIRRAQLQELIQQLQSEIKLQSVTPLVILAGDLNILGNNEEFDDVKKMMQTMKLQEIFTEHKATYNDGTALDHMFLSREFLVRRKETRMFVSQNDEPVSDHHALWVNIILNDEK